MVKPQAQMPATNPGLQRASQATRRAGQTPRGYNAFLARRRVRSTSLGPLYLRLYVLGLLASSA